MLADMPPVDDEIRKSIKPILDWLASESWKDDVKEFEATGDVPDVRFGLTQVSLEEDAWQTAVKVFERTGRVSVEDQSGQTETADQKTEVSDRTCPVQQLAGLGNSSGSSNCAVSRMSGRKICCAASRPASGGARFAATRALPAPLLENKEIRIP